MSLFPDALSNPLGSKVIEDSPLDDLNGKSLRLNGKTNNLIKLLKPGQRLEQLYKQIHGKGNKAYFAFSRLHPDRPARTIAKDSAGLFHYTEDRTLTIGEYKRIASFPDEVNFIGTFSTALQRIGNSVPPLFMKAIALQIKHKMWGGQKLIPYPKTMNYLEILESAWQDHLKPRESDAPTIISLFAGGGGSSLGYSMAGYRELLAVEWDNNAVETFKLNFSDVSVYHGDIAKLSVNECMRLADIQPGELDLLDGSPPCQGVSMAGKRILNDPRNQLFKEYVRLLRGLKPKVFVMENVSGLVKGKMKLLFAEIMRELKASGYQVKCQLMNAKYFYVPQSRERLIFIGIRDDLGMEGSYPRAENKLITVRSGIEDLPHNQIVSRGHVWVDEWGKKTKAIIDVPKLKQGDKLNGRQRIRLYWDRPAPTLSKSIVHKPYVACTEIHPEQHRAISIREMGRLSSYPDSFYFFNALDCGKPVIGNSVPPLFMRSIANHIRREVLSRINQKAKLTNA